MAYKSRGYYCSPTQASSLQRYDTLPRDIFVSRGILIGDTKPIFVTEALAKKNILNDLLVAEHGLNKVERGGVLSISTSDHSEPACMPSMLQKTLFLLKFMSLYSL